MKNSRPLLEFSNVSFAWPEPESGKILVNSDRTLIKPVFESFTASIPQGLISLVGPNGSGKSTFMLLAGARIMPFSGKVVVWGKDSRVLSGIWRDERGSPGEGLTAKVEHARNLLCSFIYQNMEFEENPGDERTVEDLLEFVFENGGYKAKDSSFYKDVNKAMELISIRDKKLYALSKGEMQRVLIGFSALYGSQIIMMDEPIFALEQTQKEKALEFFKNLYYEKGVSIIVSLHELSLTKKFADTVMLFYPDRRIDLGSAKKILSKENLEKAYGVPESMLYDSEKLTREVLLENSKMYKNLRKK